MKCVGLTEGYFLSSAAFNSDTPPSALRPDTSPFRGGLFYEVDALMDSGAKLFVRLASALVGLLISATGFRLFVFCIAGLVQLIGDGPDANMPDVAYIWYVLAPLGVLAGVCLFRGGLTLIASMWRNTSKPGK
jgi:hypothetical protein